MFCVEIAGYFERGLVVFGTCWGPIEFLGETFWLGTGLGYTDPDTWPGEGPDKNNLVPGTNSHNIIKTAIKTNKYV